MKKGQAVRVWRAARWLLYCFFVALVVTSGVHLFRPETCGRNHVVLYCFVTLCCLLLVCALWRRGVLDPEGRRFRWIRFIDIVLMNGVVFLVAGELVLQLVAARSSSMLFWSRSSPAQVRVQYARQRPGETYFGFPFNSRGYHDEEFTVAGTNDLVVAVLGDSFAFGIVPHKYNFTTVMERCLRKEMGSQYDHIAVNNFGLPGIAMDEYVFLLKQEAMRTNPGLVMLCVFVGNDVTESARYGKAVAPRCCIQNWLVWLVPYRLWMLGKEDTRDVVNTQSDSLETDSVETPAYLDDVSLERPSLSKERYLEIERKRMEVCNPRDANIREALACLIRGIDDVFEMEGDKLIVVLFPDEFQVNDDLYSQLAGLYPGVLAYDISGPQRRIVAACREKGICVVDLLELLRKKQKEQRVFHLRNTHFNARGNRVVGERLAAEVVRVMGDKAANEQTTP